MLENTIENKARFFAQYFGQYVLKINPDASKYALNEVGITSLKNEWLEDAILELTPLSQITDKHAIEVSRILDSNFRQPLDDKYKDFHASRGKSHVLPVRPCRSDVADYLRSNSYALDWNGIPVTELINRGWMKYKKE